MLISALAALFKYKAVCSITILACWPAIDQLKTVKQFSNHGMRVTFSCDSKALDNDIEYGLQGVLYYKAEMEDLVKKLDKNYFSSRFKWVVVGDDTPHELNHARYDIDIVMVKQNNFDSDSIGNNGTTTSTSVGTCVQNNCISLYDVYVHPRDGVSPHEWAYWSTNTGLEITHDWKRILRRKNLMKYPFRISAPVAHYSEETYNGTFAQYLADMTVPDNALRCGYEASSLIIESVNATRVLKKTQLWNSDLHNDSMFLLLESGSAELSAGVLRLMMDRVSRLDFIMPIWLLSVGFTYLAERESASNMYVAPFTGAVWWACLGIGLVLAAAQRITARRAVEKEGAFIAVLATWLQQDASGVPEGFSGRWTFTMMSICAMLVHSYYTSAIVSALMSTGRGGPQNLRELADSRYALASEDHDFIRFSIFEADTKWDELEYLKKKKMTSNFYQDIRYGVTLLQQGYWAYHSEYHQIYPYLNTLSDDELCKIQHVDTIPEIMTWVTATPRGQWTNIFRSSAVWLQETGLAMRLHNRMRVHPPPCRAALLAERVTFWDVAPLLGVTLLAAMASLLLLGLEITVAKWKGRLTTKHAFRKREMSLISEE